MNEPTLPPSEFSACSAPSVAIYDASESAVDKYRALIHATIERTCVKRIEEIEGRVPDTHEIRLYGETEITERSGIVIFKWKGTPVCEYQAAGYRVEGWRDAVISEIRTAFDEA